MEKTKRTLFVIISGSHKRAGTYYVTQQAGKKATTIRSKAVKFSTFSEAQEFAKQNNITLDAHTFIREEEFTAYDLRRVADWEAR